MKDSQNELISNSSKARKKKIRWISVALLGAIGIAITIWLLRMHEFRYIGSYSVQSLMVWTTCDGFLSIQNEEISDARQPCELLFRDWHGRNRWKITLPMIRRFDTAVSSQLSFSQRAFGVSPDGHTIASAIADPSRPVSQRILTLIWKDGNKVGQLLLPDMGSLHHSMNVLVDGTVLLYGVQGHDINLFLMRDGRLLASGRYTSHLEITKDEIPFIQFYLAPDLSSLGIIVPQNNDSRPNFEYTTLAITGKRITLAFHWRVLGMNSPQFFTKGLVMDGNGAIYRSTGQITKPGQWQLIPASIKSSWVEQRDDSRAKVYSPDTGEAWQLPAPNMKNDPSFLSIVNITPNGRYIVQPRIAERILNKQFMQMLDWLTHFSSLKKRITSWRTQKFLYFELYERPGNFRTRIPCKVIDHATSNGSYAYNGNKFKYFIPYLSSDSSHFVLATLDLTPTGEAHTKLLVFGR